MVEWIIGQAEPVNILSNSIWVFMNKGVTEKTAASDARYRQLQLQKNEMEFCFQSHAL